MLKCISTARLNLGRGVFPVNFTIKTAQARTIVYLDSGLGRFSCKFPTKWLFSNVDGISIAQARAKRAPTFWARALFL